MTISFSRAAAVLPIFALVVAGPAPSAAVSRTTDAVALPVTWSLSPDAIAASCKDDIARATARADALGQVAAANATFSTVVVPLEDLTADLNDRLAAQQFVYNVSTDPAVRKASLACSTAVNDFGTELAARPAIYRALRAADASKTARGDAQTKLVSLWLTASERAGAGLEESKRVEFVRLSETLNDLENHFVLNVAEDHTTITLTRAALSGVSPDFVAGLKREGEAYVVPVNESTYADFMQNASDESARKAFYMAYENRAAAVNVPILEQAIGVRDRLAHIFGYPNWAAYVIADKMAQTPERVDDFLAKLDRRLFPAAKAEVATLAALKGGTLEAWDRFYELNALVKTRYSVDQQAVRQYFPVDHTIRAVLDIYAKLLSVKFAREAHPSVWNPAVMVYDVLDAATNRYIGTFALDLYPRPGKYAHFANFPILPTRTLANGRVRAPFCAILGNWPQPAPGSPALLSHDQVETFFHEFGHNMAAILADAPYETLTEGFRADFIEAPSQMLENWVWQPEILKQISANVTTGAPLPDDLITKMIAARYVGYALSTSQQVDYATIDMRYHSSGPKVDTTAVWAATTDETTPMHYAPGTHPQASFTHLMGGYDAGYYGYLWSKVYAQDMFTAFAKDGLENPAVGSRYRDDILEPAREYEPDAEVTKFLGRPMSPEAFYHEFELDPLAASPGTTAVR